LPNNTIQAAVFDLGGVVIEIVLGRTVRAWADLAGLPPEKVRERVVGDLANYARFERGDFDVDAFHRHVCDLLGRPLGKEAFLRGWLALLGGPLPGIDDLLARLQGRVRLVMLTNTNALHSAEFHRTCGPVLARFERVFESWQMGCRKPEPECFRQVIDWLEVPPERIAFFDDSAENTEAAARLGLVARLVKGPQEVERELAAMGVLQSTP
jgi:putative hydrolase of the HAD superfamily